MTSMQRQNSQRNSAPAAVLLPQDMNAEAGVLGSLLIDPGAISQVDGFLTPEHFFRDAHREIYRACLALHGAGEPTDLITVTDELERHGKLDDVGGVAYVSALPNLVPTSANAVHYGRIVARTSASRRAIDVGTRLVALGYQDPAPSDLLRTLETLTHDLRTYARSADADPSDALFPLLTDEEAEQLPASHGILGDILYAATIAILYGPSGRWKSFLALAWALCIATGRPWLGHQVTPGHVVYIAAEGGCGLGRRITAWKQQHGVTGPTHLHPLLVPVSLLDPSQVDKLIRTIQEKVSEPPVLIVIDTLSRSMPGADENTGKDGSRAFAAADDIRRAFEGVTVLMIAHPGKNEASGIRGWSGYFQWADTVLRVGSPDTKPRLNPGDMLTLTSEKPKDSEPFADIHLTAHKVAWVSDLDGGELSSLVIAPADNNTLVGASPMPPKQRLVWHMIQTSGPIGTNDLERALVASGKMARSTLYDHLQALMSAGKIQRGIDGRYSAVLASPMGPIESDSDKNGQVDRDVRPLSDVSDDSKESDTSDKSDPSTGRGRPSGQGHEIRTPIAMFSARRASQPARVVATPARDAPDALQAVEEAAEWTY